MKQLLFTACLMAASSNLFGGPIATDGTWYEFRFGGTGSFATDCTGCTATTNPVSIQTNTSPWTFSGAATVTLVDLFLVGDQFSLFDNAVLVGSTSVPGSGSCGNDIGCALTTAGYSKGIFALGGGSHSLTIQALSSPFGSGAGAFSVVATATPEPATLAMVGAAAAALVALRRRKA